MPITRTRKLLAVVTVSSAALLAACDWSTRVAIPAANTFNQGVSQAGSTWMRSNVGNIPQPPCSNASPYTFYNSTVPASYRAQIETRSFGPNITITAHRATLDRLQTAFDQFRAYNAEAFGQLRSAGGFGVRQTINNGVCNGGISNHSWGTAVDLYFGTHVDPAGDDLTQAGAVQLASYMNMNGFYWGAGFGNRDDQHFELGQEAILQALGAGRMVRF
jgi:hypothetical protein